MKTETNELKLELYWNDIPIGEENAIEYGALMLKWGYSERRCRHILHELSAYDNGDDYILIRSSRGKGFYRTDKLSAMREFREECLSKGRNTFAPIKKINRILESSSGYAQMHIENNLRVQRVAQNMSIAKVCEAMKKFDSGFDKPMLSKMENNICLPTPYQVQLLAKIYGCEASELIKTDIYY